MQNQPTNSNKPGLIVSYTQLFVACGRGRNILLFLDANRHQQQLESLPPSNACFHIDLRQNRHSGVQRADSGTSLQVQSCGSKLGWNRTVHLRDNHQNMSVCLRAVDVHLSLYFSVPPSCLAVRAMHRHKQLLLELHPGFLPFRHNLLAYECFVCCLMFMAACAHNSSTCAILHTPHICPGGTVTVDTSFCTRTLGFLDQVLTVVIQRVLPRVPHARCRSATAHLVCPIITSIQAASVNVSHAIDARVIMQFSLQIPPRNLPL